MVSQSCSASYRFSPAARWVLRNLCCVKLTKTGSEDGRGLDLTVDLPCHVALEAADDLALRRALLRAAFQIDAGAEVAAEAGHNDAVEGSVGLAVTSAVEPSALGLSGGLLDGG